MTGEVVTVMIVDDHPMVRQGLAAFLGLAEDLRLVGEAGDLAGAAEAVRRLEPDIVLLDLVLPGARGADAVAAIRAASARARILVLTSFAEPERVMAALSAGADGYLSKTVAPEDLLTAVRQVARGRSVLDEGALLAASRRSAARLPTGERLTGREMEVLGLMSEGLANREIALQLGIAEKTVKVHAGRIYAKLGAQSRAQALVLAARLGLVSLAPQETGWPGLGDGGQPT